MTNPNLNAWNSHSYFSLSGNTPQPALQSQQEREGSPKPANSYGLNQQFSTPYPMFQSNYSSEFPDSGQNGIYPGYNLSNNAAGNQVDTTLIEVGYYNNGKADEHAQSVKEIYGRYDPSERSNVHYTGVGNDESSETESDEPDYLKNKKELDDYIDVESTDAFNIMSDKINDIVEEGKSEVVNGSLGYSRNTIYENVLLSLTANPKLASIFGLAQKDVTSLEKNKDDQVVVTANVSDAIVKYVDGRLDQSGSAFQTSRAKYQKTMQNAAQHNVTLIIASGNDHELNSVFDARRRGGDTNFLAQSDNVISVAASDQKGTPTTKDDKIATFSSWGDGRYNPTITANGVAVETKFGEQDGTSFAAPQVAATVARMKQMNPNLSFNQIKAILQQSATDLYPNSSIADGAGLLNSDLAVQWSGQISQMA